MITFDDITFVPRGKSNIPSRDDIDTSVEFCGIKLSYPAIATPMSDVCNGKMAWTLASLGCMGVIHRFQPIKEEVSEYKNGWKQLRMKKKKSEEIRKYIACAIASTGDYEDRFRSLYNIGCRIFCIDTANGANISVEKAIKNLRDIEKELGTEKIYIIAGTVATGDCYALVNSWGADAVRCGLAGGSQCLTRTETGVYVPTAETIKECYAYKLENTCEAQIIADGGIRIPADLNKAIALGADVAFCGSIFAGTKESPGGILNIDGTLYKHYRGAASYAVQVETTGEEPDYVEGNESLVKYKPGGAQKVIKRFKGGMVSLMSYFDAKSIEEFRENVGIEEL